MANTGKVLLVLVLSAALLAVAFAAENSVDTAKPKAVDCTRCSRRMLRGLQSLNWRHYGGYGGGYYGGAGGWFGIPFYQENRWVSAARMDTSNERRFARASGK